MGRAQSQAKPDRAGPKANLGQAKPGQAKQGQAKPGRAAVQHGSRAAGRPGSWAAGQLGGPAQPVIWMRACRL